MGGLIVVGLVLALMIALALMATVANRRRSNISAKYAAAVPAPPLPAHTWQSAPDDPASLLGVSQQELATAPAIAQWLAQLAAGQSHVENVQTTTVDDLTLVAFDRFVEEPKRDDDDTKRYTHEFCTHFGLRLKCPILEVDRQQGMGTASLGGSRWKKMHFEFDDFNRVFAVMSGDERFAYSLFDGEMMQWFLAQSTLISLQLHDATAFARFQPSADAGDAERALAFAHGFVAHVPSIVVSDWGGAPG